MGRRESQRAIHQLLRLELYDIRSTSIPKAHFSVLRADTFSPHRLHEEVGQFAPKEIRDDKGAAAESVCPQEVERLGNMLFLVPG